MSQALAQIHPNARLGKDVVIEAFSVIYDDVEIGEGTWVGPNVTIMSGSKVGKNCRIFPGAVIGAIPQDLKFEGEYSTAIIGDNTTIRECVTVNRGTKATQKTVVGSDCLLMAYVHIAHDCIVGDHCVIANSVQVAGHVHIDDYAILGGSGGVHQFTRVGKYAMVGAGVIVTKDVPPYTKAARSPVSYTGINSIGLRRNSFDNNSIHHIQDIYRILYTNGLNNKEAITHIEQNIPPSTERDEILHFIKNSERGIMRANI